MEESEGSDWNTTHLLDDKEPSNSMLEQQTFSKKEKEYVKAVYCHLIYLTYM